MSFGWAYIGCDDIAVTSMAGPTGSILVRSDTFAVSGSQNFMLYHEADTGTERHNLMLTGSFRQKGNYNVTGTVSVTGTMNVLGPVNMWSDLVVEGNITANAFDVVHTTRTDVEVSGNTNFGSSPSHSHTITGSLSISGVTAGTEGEIPSFVVTGSGPSTRSYVGVACKLPPTTFAVSGSTSSMYDPHYPGSSTINLNLSSSIIGVKHVGAVTVNLPSAHKVPGRILIIKDEGGTQPRTSGNKITVTPSAGETIDDQGAYYIMGSRAALSLYSNGKDAWFVF
jgi:hypothetical protein